MFDSVASSAKENEVFIKKFPFDPLKGITIPRGGLTDPQGGYLQTPLIRPITTSQNKNEEEKPKSKNKDD